MQLCSLTICFLAYQTELETVDFSSLHQELLWHSSSKKCSRVQVASVYSSHRYSSHCLTELCTRVPGRWSHPLQEWIPVIYSTLSSGKLVSSPAHFRPPSCRGRGRWSGKLSPHSWSVTLHSQNREYQLDCRSVTWLRRQQSSVAEWHTPDRE